MADAISNPTDARVSLWATTLILRLVSVAVTIGNFALIARLLGPGSSGQYFVFLSVVLLIAAISDLGLSQSAIVFPAKSPESVGQIHRVLVGCAAVFSCLSAVVVLGVFALVGDVLLPAFPTDWMFVACLAVPLALYANLWNSMAVGTARLITAGKLQLAIGLFTLILNGIVLGYVRRTEGSAIFVYICGLLVQAVAMMTLARSFAAKSGRVHYPGLTRAMLGFGLRGYAGGMSTFLWMRLTVFLLNAIHGPVAVGLFSVAQQVTEKLLLPIQVIREVLYRSVTSSDRARATDDTNRCIRLTLAIVTPAMIVAAGLAPTVVATLFGSRYDGSVQILRILLAGTAVMVVPTLLAPYFLGQLARPGLLSVLAWINGLVNGAFAIWLIPTFGGSGAAVALLVSQVVGTALLLVLYVRYASTPVDNVVVVQSRDFGVLRQQLASMLGLRSAQS